MFDYVSAYIRITAIQQYDLLTNCLKVKHLVLNDPELIS